MKKITLKQNGALEHIWLEGIHEIPATAIEVTNAIADELMNCRATKKYDSTTKIVSDVVPTQAELDAIKAGEERGWRNAELRTIDINILKAEDVGADTTALRAYRQALRNYPQQGDFPYGTRPVA